MTRVQLFMCFTFPSLIEVQWTVSPHFPQSLSNCGWNLCCYLNKGKWCRCDQKDTGSQIFSQGFGESYWCVSISSDTHILFHPYRVILVYDNVGLTFVVWPLFLLVMIIYSQLQWLSSGSSLLQSAVWSKKRAVKLNRLQTSQQFSQITQSTLLGGEHLCSAVQMGPVLSSLAVTSTGLRNV